VPGEETVLGRETRDGKDFDRLAGEERCQRCGSDPRIGQGQRGKANGLAPVIA
jgi:hypothetical protein